MSKERRYSPDYAGTPNLVRKILAARIQVLKAEIDQLKLNKIQEQEEQEKQAQKKQQPQLKFTLTLKDLVGNLSKYNGQVISSVQDEGDGRIRVVVNDDETGRKELIIGKEYVNVQTNNETNELNKKLESISENDVHNHALQFDDMQAISRSNNSGSVASNDAPLVRPRCSTSVLGQLSKGLIAEESDGRASITVITADDTHREHQVEVGRPLVRLCFVKYVPPSFTVCKCMVLGKFRVSHGTSAGRNGG